MQSQVGNQLKKKKNTKNKVILEDWKKYKKECFQLFKQVDHSSTYTL